MKRLSAAAIVAALLFVSACSSDSSSSAPPESTDTPSASPNESVNPSEEPEALTPEPDPTPEVTTYADVVSGPITTAEICNSYSELVDRYTSVVAKRDKSLKGKGTDPYKAAKFVGNNAWVNEDLSVGFNKDWEAAATDALNTVSNGQAGTVESLGDYLTASLEACGFDTNYSTLASKISSIDRKQSSVVAAAEKKPWHPKGYNEWFGGDIAWKWTDESCGTRYGYCWTIRVVSKSGCYGGVYAQVNISQNDVIIGWTNDRLGSLPPGKVGKMAFTRYGGRGIKSASLTELNCR